MATKKYCDICGEETNALHTALAAASIGAVVDLGDVCEPCRTGAKVALELWLSEAVKSKKQSVMVDASTAAKMAVAQ